MATVEEQLKKLSATDSENALTVEEQIDESPNSILSFMAGIGSGAFKIPEGIVSLGATLIDLGAGTETAVDVEEFFAKINPFDEYAQATAAGKISELLVNLAVPAGIAAKTAGKLAEGALAAKKGGKYLKFGAQAGAAGAAEAAFIGDVQDAGTIGDLIGGPTQIDRNEEYNPQTELLNRLKFGTEGALFTAGLSGLFNAGKKLATEGNKLRYSNNKFNRFLDKFGSKLRARAGKDPDFFELETGTLGKRAADVNVSENVSFNIDRSMDKIYPFMKRTFDTATKTQRAGLNESLNDVLLSGKPVVNDTGQVVFGEVDQTLKNKFINDVRKINPNFADEEVKAIFDNVTDIRTTWGSLFSSIGGRLTPKDLTKFKEVMGDKFKEYLGANYNVFKSAAGPLAYKPSAQAIDKLKNLYIETAATTATSKYPQGRILGPVEAEKLVMNTYESAKLPAGFNLDKSSDVIFKVPEFFVGRTALKDAADFNGIANMADLSAADKKLFQELFGKNRDAMQTILNGTNKLSLITRQNELFEDLIKSSDARRAAGLRPMLANSYDEAVEIFGDDFKRINMDPGKKLAVGNLKPVGDAAKEIDAEIAQGLFNPLNGKYAINGVADALMETAKSNNAKSMVGKMYENFILYPKATSQIAKTILSPFTHVRNFLSAGAFATANGIIPNAQAIKMAYGALQTNLKGTRQANDLYQKLLRLGVVNSQVQIGDLTKLLEDVKFGETMNSQTGLTNLLKPLRKAKKFSQDLYTAEDDFWKIASWAMESKRLEDAFAANGLVRGNYFTNAAGQSIELTADYFEKEAANIVKNNIPNYSYVSDFIKGLRKLPVGNFVSFPAEIMRTSTNIVRRALDEIGTVVTKADGTQIRPLAGIGYTRLTGMAATTLAVPYAAVEGAKALYNVTEDEMDAIRRYVADWSKNSTIIPIRDKETGELKYVDFSHMNAYDTVTRPIQTVLNKVAQGDEDYDGIMDDFVKGLFESTKELGMPFISESIWTEAATDILIRGGRTREGFQVWNPEDTPGDKVQKMVGHLVESQAPLNYKQLTRIGLALKPVDSTGRFDERGNEYELGNELAGIAGLRAIKVDPGKGITYKISEFQKRERLAKDLFKRASLKGGVVTPEEIVDAYINANRALFDAKKNFMLDYDAAKTLNISPSVLDDKMGRISNRERSSIEEGVYRPYVPSRDIANAFEENAIKLGVPNPYVLAEPVIEAIRSLLESAPLSLEKIPDIENPFSDMPDVNLGPVAELPPLPSVDITSTANQFGNVNAVTGLTPTEQVYLDPLEKIYRQNQRKPNRLV